MPIEDEWTVLQGFWMELMFFSVRTSTMQIFFFFLYFHCSVCSTALLVGVIWPTAASINIQLLNQRYQGTLRGPTRQTSGRPCCCYLPRQSGQGSAICSFGCLCYQQGRLVRVEGDDVAGTGRWNQCQGPTFYQWIAKGVMWGRQQRKVKKKKERGEWSATALVNTLTLSRRCFVFTTAGRVGSNLACWNVNTSLTSEMPPSSPFRLADVSKLCLEGWKCSHPGHLALRNYRSHIHSKWPQPFHFSESWEIEVSFGESHPIKTRPVDFCWSSSLEDDAGLLQPSSQTFHDHTFLLFWWGTKHTAEAALPY